MPGTNYHCGYQVIAAPTWMEEAHCHHGVEEYFVMIGANIENVWDWDAEIDIMLGEDIDHMEQFTVDRPVIVRIPPNLWHCPINFRKINKPILWQAVYLNGTWGKTLARKRPDGMRYFEFMGDGIQVCRKNPNAKCTYCGRCFKEAMAASAAK